MRVFIFIYFLGNFYHKIQAQTVRQSAQICSYFQVQTVTKFLTYAIGTNKKGKQRLPYLLLSLSEGNGSFGRNEQRYPVADRKVYHVENPHKRKEGNTHQSGEDILGVVTADCLG